MEQMEMVPRAKLERLLENARQEKDAAVVQAVDSLRKTVQLQLNMRDIAIAKISVVKKAASETPNKPVHDVWVIAEKARPAPPISTTKRMATSLPEPPAKRVAPAAPWTFRSPPTTMNPDVPAPSTSSGTRVSCSPDIQTSPAVDLKAGQDLLGTTFSSTTDMATWTLSTDQAQVLLRNKTVTDLLKARTGSSRDQQISDLETLRSQKDDLIGTLRHQHDGPEARLKKEVHANLCAENTSLHAEIVTINNMRKVSEATVTSITQSVLKSPNQSVKQAWEVAVRDHPVQLVHRTKPRSDHIRLASDSIAVNVGSPATVFSISQKLLCDASDFFKLAMKQEWREGQTKIVNLPDDEPKAVSVWLNWLYRHHLPVGLNAGEKMTHESVQDVWNSLIMAYCLGDKLLDSDYKDAVVDAMAAWTFKRHDQEFHFLIDLATRTKLFESTSAGSTARKFLVHTMARVKDHLVEEDDHVLLFEVLKLNISANPDFGASLNAARSCEFHEHKPGERYCYREKYTVASICSD